MIYLYVQRCSSGLLVGKTNFSQAMCHTVAFAIYIKTFIKAKEELWKLKHFTMQKYNLQKIL
jgi:hypothetical protein